MGDALREHDDPAPDESWMARPGPPDPAAHAPGPTAVPLPPIDVVVRGDVPHDEIPGVHNKLVDMMSALGEPVLHARLKLTMLTGAGVERPVVAEAVLDVGGEVVRAHVGAASTLEAADLLQWRLRDRLDYRRRRRSGHDPAPPAHRPSFVDLPAEERELVRHKALALVTSTPEEATFDMEALDYDFRLFVDRASGTERVVWREEDGGHAVSGPPVVVGSAAALERLNAGHERFVFFQDDTTGRGNIAYRRYDGHDGLITPAAADAP